jgi:hypothetical protein
MTRSRLRRTAAFAALLGVALALAAWAEEKPPAPAATPAPPAAEADDPALDPDAVAVVKRMVDALQGAKALHVRVDEEYDALQSDGETFSFGKSSDMTLRRPDRFRVEGADRSGQEHVSTYDGKRVTVFMADKNVFASVDRTGDVDSVVDFLRDDVGMKLPLAGLFSPNLGAFLLENVTDATYIDEELLDGVNLDHVAFHYGDGIGIQLWVPVEGEAFPRRLVMTFEDARGRPQFRADFRSWDTSPDVSDKRFAFVAPKGARSVPFVLPKTAESVQPPSPATGGGM